MPPVSHSYLGGLKAVKASVS